MDSDHPQRIKAPEPPGLLLKRAFTITRKLKILTMANDPAYLAMVRECPCLRCGLDPSAEAAHVRMSSGARGKAGGMRKKPDDKYSLPLCSACHIRDADSQHKVACTEVIADRDVPSISAKVRFQWVSGTEPGSERNRRGL